MVCKIAGVCVHIGEPRKLQTAGKPDRVVKEFGFLVTGGKQMPEVVKVVSFNGFSPELNKQTTFDASVRLRHWKDKNGKDQSDIVIEVL